jgi:hypothetical protein
LTPTLNSCAGARSLRFETNSADASPSDVESPMYTTCWHDVWVAGGSGLGGTVDVLGVADALAPDFPRAECSEAA